MTHEQLFNFLTTAGIDTITACKDIKKIQDGKPIEYIDFKKGMILHISFNDSLFQIGTGKSI